MAGPGGLKEQVKDAQEDILRQQYKNRLDELDEKKHAMKQARDKKEQEAYDQGMGSPS